MHPLAGRRAVAAVLDAAVVLAPLGAVAAVNAVAVRRGRRMPAAVPGSPRVAVPLLVTVPAAALLGVADARGGSPGKRAVGLAVVADGGVARAVLRRLVLTALPWELGHQGVWSSREGSGVVGGVLLAASYGTLGVLAVQAARGDGRSWADRLAGTRVVLAA